MVSSKLLKQLNIINVSSGHLFDSHNLTKDFLQETYFFLFPVSNSLQFQRSFSPPFLSRRYNWGPPLSSWPTFAIVSLQSCWPCSGSPGSSPSWSPSPACRGRPSCGSWCSPAGRAGGGGRRLIPPPPPQPAGGRRALQRGSGGDSRPA